MNNIPLVSSNPGFSPRIAAVLKQTFPRPLILSHLAVLTRRLNSSPWRCLNLFLSFDALDWLALLTTHIPNMGEQMVRYYGYYSNKSCSMRKKAGRDTEVSALIDSDVCRKAFRKNWARLIQKIYNVDSLVCPRCHSQMRVISYIEQADIIEKILRHLDLWETRNHDPPTRKATHIPELIIDPAYSQLPETEYWLQ